MAEEANRPKRRPLTGVVSIEWVDAADPDDPVAEPNFGSFGVTCEPPLEGRRLIALLRWEADNQQKMLDEEESDSGR
jgi:hypothetical protein